MDLTRYDHVDGWSIELQLPAHIIRECLKGIASFPVRDSSGKSIPFYAEDDVKRACHDHLIRTKPIGQIFRAAARG